ncbi:MAG: cache domain-containing protein, partial [Pseudanabaena sp.]
MGLSLLLIAIGTSLLGLGGLGYLFYQELLSSSQREMSQSAELQSTQIESKLNSVRQSADTVALNVKALFQQTPKQKTVDRYQKLVIDGVQKSDLVAGIGIVQNENLLFTVPKPTVPYVLKEQSGLKLEGATQKLTAPNDKLLVGNRSDFQNSPLYKSPATNSKESWSEPYSALGKTLVTYSSPILDGQKVLGVVNADAIASNLVAISNVSANSESKIGIVVVSASGRVITSSDQLATQLQNPATAEAIKNLVQQAKSQPTGIAQTGGNLWAYRKIQGSDWIVASSLPESEITNKLLLLVGGAAIGISTILAIAILSFINSLKKRLQPLTEECDRFLAQQGTTDLNLEGKDEIDRLGLSLKNTLQKAKNNELRLRSESNQTVDLDSSTSPQIQEDFVEAELTKEEVGNLLDVVSSMIEGVVTVEAEVNDRAAGLVSDTFNR